MVHGSGFHREYVRGRRDDKVVSAKKKALMTRPRDDATIERKKRERDRGKRKRKGKSGASAASSERANVTYQGYPRSDEASG